MNQADSQPIDMDAAALYLEEVFTDRRVGVIKRLSPVTAEGTPDASRAVIYSGETQILLGNNPLPINFEIEAQSLAEATKKFSASAQTAAHNTIKQLEEMRREMASQIVVPGQGGGMPGGLGGGKIQLP